jgi:hypothetical protein
MGRVFGRTGLKNILRQDKPFPKNAPTSNAFKVKELNGNMELEKRNGLV